MRHDRTLHAAMAFDGTSKVIDAWRESQHEFKALAGSQGYPLLDRTSLWAGLRHDLDSGLIRKSSLKPVRFPTLIPHQQAHGLPGPHVHPSRCESKIFNDDGHVLVFGGTSHESQYEERQEFDHPPAPC